MCEELYSGALNIQYCSIFYGNRGNRSIEISGGKYNYESDIWLMLVWILFFLVKEHSLFISLYLRNFKKCEGILYTVTLTEDRLCSTKKCVCVKVREQHGDYGNRHTSF